MIRYAYKETLLVLVREEELGEGKTIKGLSKEKDAEVVVCQKEDGHYYAFDVKNGEYRIADNTNAVDNIYRAIGVAFENILGEEIHGDKLNEKTELDKVRRDLHIFMRINADVLDDWLWDSLNDAVFDDKQYVISLLEDYGKSSLSYMGWTNVDLNILKSELA